MSQVRDINVYAQRLISEYNRARRPLRKYLKTKHNPEDVTKKIAEIISNTSIRQSKIIGYTLNMAFQEGAKEGNKELSNATISAAAVEFDLTKVSDLHLRKITKDTIGHIGKYNTLLSKQLQLEYKTLLVDNRLITSLSKDGWTPWLDKALTKRGVSMPVIALAKGQTTTTKIINILEMHGIRGGKHPREVGKLLIPHVQRYFGPFGVIIDNRGKYRRALEVKANGEFKWIPKKITRAFKATPKSYADLIARSSMVQAHNEGRMQSLEASKLTKGFRWSCVNDAASCITCLSMHGQEITKSEFPPAHPRCRCHAAPLWKDSSGLKNKEPEYYFKQRDTAIYRKYKLQEFNKTLPRGTPKLKFDTMLPEGTVGQLPDAKAMYEIRKTMLK